MPGATEAPEITGALDVPGIVIQHRNELVFPQEPLRRFYGFFTQPGILSLHAEYVSRADCRR
jgi:hypothetical protein